MLASPRPASGASRRTGMDSKHFDFKITVRGPVPRISYEEIARDVLGPRYQLSLVICGDKLAQRINKEYRKKGYYPNVLSFELDALEGEIFLNIRKAAREARQYKTTLQKRVALLFVHGLYHLKGYAHERESDAKRMEARERQTLAKHGLA